MNNITEKQIIELLDKCEFRHSCSGYRYAVEIIKACAENPRKTRCIVKTYAILAEPLGTTGPRFERALRHAISQADVPHMTNKEFICRAINCLTYGTDMPTTSKCSIK